MDIMNFTLDRVLSFSNKKKEVTSAIKLTRALPAAADVADARPIGPQLCAVAEFHRASAVSRECISHETRKHEMQLDLLLRSIVSANQTAAMDDCMIEQEDKGLFLTRKGNCRYYNR